MGLQGVVESESKASRKRIKCVDRRVGICAKLLCACCAKRPWRDCATSPLALAKQVERYRRPWGAWLQRRMGMGTLSCTVEMYVYVWTPSLCSQRFGASSYHLCDQSLCMYARCTRAAIEAST